MWHILSPESLKLFGTAPDIPLWSPMISLMFVLFACSFSTPVAPPAPVVKSAPLSPVQEAKATSLEDLTNTTIAKMTEEYANVILGRSGSSSVIYFSGPETGMTEISGFPIGPTCQGVLVAKDGLPLWQAIGQEGDMFLSRESTGPTTGQWTEDGGGIISGKNDVNPDAPFIYFATELDKNDSVRAVTLFRGWWAVHVNGDGGAHHFLMTRPDRSIMLIGLAPKAVVQLAIMSQSDDRSTIDAPEEKAFDLTEVRNCTVPRNGFSSISWSSCETVARKE